MQATEKQKLIMAWLDMSQSEMDSETHENNFWAHEKLWELCQYEPEKAFEIILKLIDVSPNDHVLMSIAAGPLEDLMCYHGVETFAKIKEISGIQPKLIKTMKGVWLDSEDTPVWKEFYELAGIEPPFSEDED